MVFVVGPRDRGHCCTDSTAVENVLFKVTIGWMPADVARLARDHPNVLVPHTGARGAVKFVGGTPKRRADFKQIGAAVVDRNRLPVADWDTIVLPPGYKMFQPPGVLMPKPAPFGTCELSVVATFVEDDDAIAARLANLARHSTLRVPTADKSTWWSEKNTEQFLSRRIGGRQFHLARQSKSRDKWERAKMLHRCLLAAHEGLWIVEGKMGIDTHRFLIDGWHGLFYAVDPGASGHVIEPEDFATETAARGFFAENYHCTQLGKVDLVVVKEE